MRKTARMDEKTADRWSECLQAVVLTLSDSQLVTGNAMLVSAIYLMNNGTMVVYHFNTVTNLAWLSGNTHLLSLLAIRALLNRDAKVPRAHSIIHEDILKYFRISLMLLLAVLLLYCTWISGYTRWYTTENIHCPVLCTKKHLQATQDISGEPRKWLIVTFVLVLSGYPFAVLFAFTRPVGQLRGKLLPFYQKLTNRKRHSLIIWLINRLLCSLVMVWLSDLEDMLEGIVWFVLGTYWTIKDRNDIKNWTFDVKGFEDDLLMPSEEWKKLGQLGFGQLVPLFLLLLPLLSLIESWKGIQVNVHFLDQYLHLC
jgi:hypothetical protein